MAELAHAPSDDLLDRLAPLRPVPGVESILAHQAADVFSLWAAWEAESGGRALPPPFWAVAWPASVVLARAVLEAAVPVRGRRVLEIGCGGGVAAIAAARAGAAAVEANDVDAVALHVASRNAGANGLALRLTSADYAEEAAVLDAEVVLAADLFYEQQVSERLLAGLRALRRRGAAVLVADAGRPFAPRADVVLLREATVAVDVGLEGVASRHVRLLSLS